MGPIHIGDNMKRLSLAVSLAIVTWACDGGSPFSSPTSPSATSPGARPPAPPPNATYTRVTLSGVVFDVTPTGRVPLGRVDVYCEACGEFGHKLAQTDTNGFYSFTEGVWLSAGIPTALWVGKDGYQDPAGLPAPHGPFTPSEPGWREVTIDGDTRFDIELVRR